MRQAASEYLAEEARLRGARPRVKAVLYPFDLDYGLAPGSGEYLDTSYGGEPGKLALAEGYYTTASWTSPVVPAFAPYLDSVCPSWEDRAAQMDVQVYLRTGKTPAEVSGAAYTLVTPGLEFPLGPYFQLRVEFRQNIRSWAVDQSQEADEFTAYGVDSAPAGGYESYGVAGESSGYLANLRLEGRLSLPESEIIDPGAVGVDLARDFSELRAGSQVLVLDHRRGQWLTRTTSSYLQGLAETAKQVDLYHGWELPRRRGGLAIGLPGRLAAPYRHGPRLAGAASGPGRKSGLGDLPVASDGGGAHSGRGTASLHARQLPGPGGVNGRNPGGGERTGLGGERLGHLEGDGGLPR